MLRKAHFGKPIPVLCKRFGLRLTRPDIIHGATPKATKRRRVIYSWHTGIGDDNETLERLGQHIWSELSALCRGLTWK